MKNKFWLMLAVVFVFSISLTNSSVVSAAGGMVWHTNQKTTSAFNKMAGDFQISGSKIYYIWPEYNSSNQYEIWTAEANLDGSNFIATQRTTNLFVKTNTQMDIEGSKIYYIWRQMDASNRAQIWTAVMNLDGTGWSATQRTSFINNQRSHRPEIDVDGAKIYYVWEDIFNNSLWTAVMNTDGTGFTSTERTQGLWSRAPKLKVVGTKIYYVFEKFTTSAGPHRKIMTAVMNTDGTGFTATERYAVSSGAVWDSDLIVDGTKIYYIWHDLTVDPAVAHKEKIMMGKMNTDGSNFEYKEIWNMVNTVPAGNTNFNSFILNNNVFYLTWEEYDTSSIKHLYTGTLSIDFTEFRPIQRTFTAFDSINNNLKIDGDKIYYYYVEKDSSNYYQVWTSIEDNTQTINNTSNVTATVPSSLTFNVTGVTAGNACANSGGNASVTTTATNIPFGVYNGAQTKIACQTLTVSTNATDGYVVTVQQNQDLTSAGSDIIAKFSGTYALPTIWATPPGSGTNSYFGFTTDDTDYSSFQLNKYSKFAANITPYAIALETQPVVDEANVISYQLEVNTLQEAGTYVNTVMYIATATF